MDRKEFNKILRRYDYQRKSSKDEYGDRIYTYTHDEVGVVLTVDQHTVDLEGSSWSCYHFEQAAALLVGAVGSSKCGIRSRDQRQWYLHQRHVSQQLVSSKDPYYPP